MTEPISRREFLTGAVAVGGALTLSGALEACGSTSASASSHGSGGGPPIKIGTIDDLTGDFALPCIPRSHAYALAVKNINAKGGVLGRKLQHIQYDGQSTVSLYETLAEKLILEDNVDVIMAGYTSSEREAARAVAVKHKKIFWHNNQGEGGIVSRYSFFTGPVPNQQILPGVKWMIDHYGPNMYIIAADYGFGVISTQWTHVAAGKYGGRVVGQELIPLTNTQYASTIANIQKAKPDWVMELLVGDSQDQFFPQAVSAGLSVPALSSVLIQQGYEQKRFKAPALANMHVPVTYIQEIPTASNAKFVKYWHRYYPHEPDINQPAGCGWEAVHLMAEGWRRAGTTATEKVIDALETGVSFAAPQGTITINPNNHECEMPIRMANVTNTNAIKWVADFGELQPDTWEIKDLGVNLRKHDPETQYFPTDDPKLKKYLKS